MKPYTKQGYMYGGYVLSRKALELLTTQGLKNGSLCRMDSEGSHEIEMGKCLENLGVVAGDTRDNLRRDRFLPFTPENHLIDSRRNQSFEFFTHAYYPQGS
ncbi:unnamed protein product, partial [Allacma fusca]